MVTYGEYQETDELHYQLVRRDHGKQVRSYTRDATNVITSDQCKQNILHKFISLNFVRLWLSGK